MSPVSHHQSIPAHIDRVVKTVVCKDWILILSFGRAVRSFVVMFFPLSYFSHICGHVCGGVDVEEPFGFGKKVILILVHLSLSFDFIEEFGSKW